jgi:ABC-type multidrug transport system fused ATPase/permease subunit
MLETKNTFRVLSLLGERKRMAGALLALITCGAAFDISVPFITQRLIDTLIQSLGRPGGNLLPVLLSSAAGILVATVLQRAIKSFYDYNLFRTATSLEDTLRNRSFEKYLRMHALYHSNSNSGQIIGRIDRGCTAMFAILHDIFGQSLVPPLIVFAGVLGSLLFKNAVIAGIVFLPLPIYLLVVRRLTERIYDMERQVSEDFEVVSKESYDVASNVSTVKKFSQEKSETVNQAHLLARARQSQYRVERLWALIENIQTLIATLGRVSIIVAGGLLVLWGKATIGELVLYITLQNMAYQPISQLSVIFPRLRRNMSRVERVFELLDARGEVQDKPNAQILPPLSSRIEFRDVWFRYGKDKRWVLKNVDVTVPAGATVALIGASGSGKTTFINLLLRSFDPERGSILIDGVDLRDAAQESLRSQIAVVPQEVDLFSRSIAENIAYGKTGVTKEDVVRAAGTALAHDFIMRAEQGYETVVGERGLKLSGGERQRIGIARAVLREPRIFILDEATSHLDTESERLIQEATRNVIKDRTSFLIAHRLSTIRHADFIIVFADNTIEAIGTHEQLAFTSPTYRRLHALQTEAARVTRQVATVG